MKVSSRSLYVPRNLFAKRLDRRELDFVAQPVEKTNFNLAFGRQIDGMEIQQVRFDRE